MELREAIGVRRSIRFLLPHKPVERDKIQRMLEAARLASHWGNINSLRAIVVERDKAPQEVIDALPSPVGGYQIQLAPVVIVWYIETAACDNASSRLRELVDAGAIGYGEKKREELENTLVPLFDKIGDAVKAPGLGELDCGQGIAQATLVAFEQGLGTCCLGTANADAIRTKLGLPDSCRVLVTQTVGYPAESAEAGGQRPRLPFEELFQLNNYGEAFPRDPEVVSELERDRMIQGQAFLQRGGKPSSNTCARPSTCPARGSSRRSTSDGGRTHASRREDRRSGDDPLHEVPRQGAEGAGKRGHPGCRRRRGPRARRPRRRLRGQLRGRARHRPGVDSRTGGARQHRSREDPHRERRERLRERLDGLRPGQRDR